MCDYSSVVVLLVLLLGVLIGLSAQEIPYVVYGTQDWNSENSDYYYVWDHQKAIIILYERIE
ncbi:hypothetical protein MASR1M36_23010 [Candidatus Cloacimonadaceae bacterium]